MKIKYFTDTDTALIEFASNTVSETQEISEDINLDLDGDGRLVNITIERARRSANIKELSYQEIRSGPG